MYHAQNNLDKFLNETYFKNKINGTFLECGAFDGVIDSNTYFFYKNLNWRGINIEPLPNIFQHLVKNRPEDININAALSDKTSIQEFTQAIASDVPYYNGHFGNGSLQHTEKHREELINRNCKFERFNIETYTINDLFEKINFDKRIDLFVLDVEGHEVNVLSKFKNLKNEQLPYIVCAEYGHSGLKNIKDTIEDLDYSLEYVDAINAVFINKG